MTTASETKPKRATCPECGGEAVPIAYGYPDAQALERARRGEIELGGCVVGENQPRWACRQCGRLFSDRPR